MGEQRKSSSKPTGRIGVIIPDIEQARNKLHDHSMNKQTPCYEFPDTPQLSQPYVVVTFFDVLNKTASVPEEPPSMVGLGPVGLTTV